MRTLRSAALGGLCGLGLMLWPTPSGAQTPPPRVVVAWAGGLMEVRVAFDRAIDPEVAKQVVGQAIEFGEGEKPGIAGRAGGDRGTLRVASAKLVDDGRTLVLVTDPHPREATYRLALPVGAGPKVAVDYDLSGVEVVAGTGDQKWSGWWPVLDPKEAQRLTAGSAEHDRFWSSKRKADVLTLQTSLAVPKGEAFLALDATRTFDLTFGVDTAKAEAASPESWRTTLKADSSGEPIFVSLTFPSVEGVPGSLKASVGGRPIARSAFVLPWAPPGPPASPPSTIPPQLLTGGDPAKGEVVFFGEQAKCATCHQARGKGGVIGPDLSNLAGRDRAWVYQNIIEPSASIHPNYVSYTVAMKDGRIAMGVVRAEGADAVKVSDIDAKQTVIPRSEIEEIRPSSSSIMPVGLLGAIGEDNTRDLLAYLTAGR